jgi:hypothetical protein
MVAHGARRDTARCRREFLVQWTVRNARSGTNSASWIRLSSSHGRYANVPRAGPQVLGCRVISIGSCRSRARNVVVEGLLIAAAGAGGALGLAGLVARLGPLPMLRFGPCVTIEFVV